MSGRQGVVREIVRHILSSVVPVLTIWASARGQVERAWPIELQVPARQVRIGRRVPQKLGDDGECRVLGETAFLSEIDRLLGPQVTREFINKDVALEAPIEAPIVDVMAASLLAEDPDASVAPYVLGGGTDAKAFSRLGVAGYGFAPLRLPAGLDFAGLFHGVDERVPIDSLQFGVRVLNRFLRAC